jgi:CRISPR/Cas system-associated exonuclease Cas4 (RecB family)
MLSVNEDLIPSSKTTHSFIPYDIRRTFHLPTYQHKNAVYAYHIYRLLQRAEKVHLVYNTEPDELGGGEKSRFIKQIQQELASFNPAIKIIDQILSAPPVPGQEYPPVKVEKTSEILDLLKEKGVKGFSPTSLNSYRRCHLQFYFSSIAGIEEQKELEDTIDPQVLGQAVHDVLNKLYQPYVNLYLSSEIIDSMIPLIGSLMDKAFERKYKGSDITYGKNLLLVNVANIMVRNFLNEEKKEIEKFLDAGSKPTVKLLEKLLTKTVKLQLTDQVGEITLKGFVDRVDLIGKKIRIIDYKTGLAEKKELELNDWMDLLNNPEMDKCFQLLMYAYLLDNYFGIPDPSLEAGIISLKKVKSGFLPVVISVGNNNTEYAISKQSLEYFEDVLFRILGEIFDPLVPFDQTGNLDICLKCPYINFCGR